MAKGILDLPHELLLIIYHTQTDLLDALALSRTCQLLRNVWQTNARLIADTIFSRELHCYAQAESLAIAQEALQAIHTEMSQHQWPNYSTDEYQAFLQSLPEVYEDKDHEQEGIQRRIRRLYTTQHDEMLQRGPNSWDSNGQNVKEAIDWDSTLLRRLRRLRANARESALVCDMITPYFTIYERSNRDRPYCSVHPPHLLPHERERTIKSFYNIRLNVLSHFLPKLRPDCDKALNNMNPVEADTMHNVVYFLCNCMDMNHQDELGLPELGLRDKDSPIPVYGDHPLLPEWLQAKDRIGCAWSGEIESHYRDLSPWIFAPCERCYGPPCKERGAKEGLWDITGHTFRNEGPGVRCGESCWLVENNSAPW